MHGNIIEWPEPNFVRDELTILGMDNFSQTLPDYYTTYLYAVSLENRSIVSETLKTMSLSRRSW